MRLNNSEWLLMASLSFFSLFDHALWPAVMERDNSECDWGVFRSLLVTGTIRIPRNLVAVFGNILFLPSVSVHVPSHFVLVPKRFFSTENIQLP